MSAVAAFHPLATHDPVASLRQDIFWGRVWTLALSVSAIAFIALGVVAITLTSVFWPANLPVVSILVLAGGVPMSSNLIQRLWNQVEFYQKEAKYDEALKKEMDPITTGQLNQNLKNIGISSNARESVKKFLMARYLVLENEVKYFKEKAIIQDEVELWVENQLWTVRPSDYRISKVNFDDPQQVSIFEALQQRYLNRDRLLHSAAVSHLKAAYILHLIQQPDDLRDFKHFVKLTATNPLQHLIAKRAQDPSAHVIAVANGSSYTQDQLLKTSAAKLAKAIFAARLNWF